MLDFLKPLATQHHDAIFVLPGDKKDQLHIETAVYKNPGESVNKSPLGNSYHVVLFKEDTEKDCLYDIDCFDAVFCDHLEYMSNLIPANWYIIMARKTTTSHDFIQKTIDKLKSA